MSSWKCCILLAVALACVLKNCKAQDKISMVCDPRADHRFDDCPDGYCCVRDEFLPLETLCKRIGQEGDGCFTQKFSQSDCPCLEGLQCQPNIVSASFTSLYGQCVNATAAEDDLD